MANSKLFLVKLKVVDNSNPHIKFKPAFIKGVVGAVNAKDATNEAYNKKVAELKGQFPEADLKHISTINLNADFMFFTEKAK